MTREDVMARGGIGLVALGALHTAATLAGAGPTLAAMIADGWWRTADVMASAPWERVACFWGLWFGFVVVLLGWALWRAGRRPPALSRGLAIALVVVSLAGALAVPAGGFWLVAALGVWLVVKSG